MDRQEFQRRRRALEELYQADLRLLRAAHESRVRSLEALWTSLDGGDAALPPPSAFLLPAAEGAPASTPEPAEAPALPARSRNPDLRTALQEILPALPEVFDKSDVLQVLGWNPSRSSLYRVLADMVTDGLLRFDYLSGGRRASQFRKV